MLISPPNDELIEKVGCRYALVTLAAKRARQLSEQSSEELEKKKMKPVSVAAQEIYDGKVTAIEE